MLITGCNYHPGFQQIAYVDTETGELQERRIRHREEVEASGHARWFERLQQKVLSRSRSARVEGACRRGFNIKYEVGPASGLPPRSRLNGTVRSWSDSTIIVEVGCESA